MGKKSNAALRAQSVPVATDINMGRDAVNVDTFVSRYFAAVIPFTLTDTVVALVKDKNECPRKNCKAPLDPDQKAGELHSDTCANIIKTRDILPRLWKVPGGSESRYDAGDFKVTAMREIEEEIGLVPITLFGPPYHLHLDAVEAIPATLYRPAVEAKPEHDKYAFPGPLHDFEGIRMGLEIAEIGIFTLSDLRQLLTSAENDDHNGRREIYPWHAEVIHQFLSNVVPYVDEYMDAFATP